MKSNVIARTAQQSAKPIKNKSDELNAETKQTVKNLTNLTLPSLSKGEGNPKERDFKHTPLFWRGAGGEVKALAMTFVRKS
ncbi:MAG: hypothetical protein ACYDCN_17140 [Bacteroidia bacterium]